MKSKALTASAAAASQAPASAATDLDMPEPCVMSAYKAGSGRRVPFNLTEEEILDRLDKIDTGLVRI